VRAELTSARLDVPSTVICTRSTAKGKAGVEWTFLAGLAELRNVTWLDLPTVLADGRARGLARSSAASRTAHPEPDGPIGDAPRSNAGAV
jgi:hypothetical protein